jgi:hypothetical protein
MLKRCTIYSFFLVTLFLLNVEKVFAQDCSSVTAAQVATTPATCPGNGTITAPTLASTTVYQLSGGGIAGQLQQNSPVFESLTAGSYTLTLLCTGEPAKTLSVVVEDKHSPLGMSLTGTMVCANSGIINATATGGFNEGVGASYQYAYWPESAGGANRGDAGLTYGSSSTFGGTGTLAEGKYFVRVKDNCGNIFTQSIDIKPSKPTGKVSLGNPTISCTGGVFGYNFPNAQLQAISGVPITDFTTTQYEYRVEKVSTSGDCASAAIEGSVIINNTPITSASTLSSINIPGVVPGARYRIVITSPCGDVETATCFTAAQVANLEVRPTRLCTPVGTNDIRLTLSFYSPDDVYAIQLPVTLVITGTGGGGYSQTITATTGSELYSIETSIPSTAFPLSVTGTDNCGVTRTTNYNSIPPVGAAPSNVTFFYRHSCVQDNGNVNVTTYTVGNWYGMEYNTGSDADKTKYELITTDNPAVVVATVYGLSNVYANEIRFPNVPAGTTYRVRVTPPAGSGTACNTPQVSNPVTIPASEGLVFNVTPTVEKICNNGLNNINYNTVISHGTLTYALYSGTSATGTPVSTFATPVNLPAGQYYYVVTRPASGCSPAATRQGPIVIDSWQTNPTISRSLSVNCQPLGSGPQNTGTALLQFSGFGPFRVEKSENGGSYTEVAAAAVSSYTETSLTAGTTYTYRVTDQCGKSVSQQVMIKPLSPRLTNNTVEPCVGQSFTLSAIDFGDPLTTYTWEKVGVSGVLANTREHTFSPFTAADNGTYKLTVSLLNGCVVRETFITLNSSNCGNPFATGSIGDKVWFDNNSNGIQDAGEAGVPGVPVSLQAFVGGMASPTPADLANEANWTDVPSASTVTDANGEYLFDGLETGHYRVKFGTVPNYGFTTPNQGGDDALDSDAGAGGFSGPVFINALGVGIDKDNMTVDAGLVPAGSIGDYVWLDDNQNGQQDAGELPKADIPVKLYVKNGSVWDLVETTTTGSDGKYLFDGLPAGTYQVEFVLPANHVFTYSDKAGVPDTEDSDANQTTGKSGEITIDPSLPVSDIGRNNMTIDAGIVEGALPVKLSSFDVKKGENVSAVLRWTTTEELNSDRFEIQRSADAKVWTIIGTVAANVNSAVAVPYRFDDKQPLMGANYYRLKMIDKDESFAYSSIKKLSGEVGAEVTIYPNPVSNELSVLSTTGQAIGKVEVISQNGKVLITRNGGNIASPINVKSLPAGTYLVKISFQNGTVENRKVVIVR